MDLGQPVDLGFFKTNEQARNDVTATDNKLRKEADESSGLGTPIDLGFFKNSEQSSTPQDSGSTEVKDYGISLVKGVVGAAQGVYGIADLATLGGLERGVNAVTGTTVGEKAKEATDYLSSKQSPTMQRKEQELAETKGFLNSAGKVLSDPALAGSMLAESVPVMLSMAGAIRKVGAMTFAKVFESTMEREVAAGVAQTAARATAMSEATVAAASRGTLASIGVNAAIEAGSNSQDVKSTIMSMDRADLEMSPQFQKLIADGRTEREARLSLSQDAGNVAGAIAGVIGGAATKYSGAGAFESQVVRQIFGFGAKDAASVGKKALVKELAHGVASETLEEGAQSFGEKFGENVGKNYIGKVTPLMEGVPEAVAAGATLGGISGGLFAGAGHAMAGGSEKKKEEGDTQGTKNTNTSKPPNKQGGTESPLYDAPPLTEQVLRKRANTQDGMNFLAALHNMGSAADKAVIEDFLSRTSLRKPFESALNSPTRLDAGKAMLGQDEAGNQFFMDSVKAFVNSPSKRGKAKYVPPVPLTEAEASNIPSESDADAQKDLAALNAQSSAQGKPPISGNLNGVQINNVTPKTSQKVDVSKVDFNNTNTPQFIDSNGAHYDIVNVMNKYKDEFGGLPLKQHAVKAVEKFLSTGEGKLLGSNTAVSDFNLEDTKKNGELRFNRTKSDAGTLVIPPVPLKTPDAKPLTKTQEKLRHDLFMRKTNLLFDSKDHKVDNRLDQLLGFPTDGKTVSDTHPTHDTLLQASALMDLVEKRMADAKIEQDVAKQAAIAADKATKEVNPPKEVLKTLKKEPAVVADSTADVTTDNEHKVLNKSDALIFNKEQTPKARAVSDFMQRYAKEVHAGIKQKAKLLRSPEHKQIKDYVAQGTIFSNDVKKMPKAVQQYYNSRNATDRAHIDEALSNLKPSTDTSGEATPLNIYKSYVKQSEQHGKAKDKAADVKIAKKDLKEKTTKQVGERNKQAKDYADSRTKEDKVRTRLKTRIAKIMNLNDSVSSLELIQQMRVALEEKYNEKVQSPTQIDELELAIATIEAKVEHMDSYVQTLQRLDGEIQALEDILRGQKPRSDVEYVFIRGADGNVFGNFAQDPGQMDAARAALNNLIDIRRNITRRNGPALRDLFFANAAYIREELNDLKIKAMQYVEDNPGIEMTTKQVIDLFKDAEAQTTFVLQAQNTGNSRFNALSKDARQLSDATSINEAGQTEVSQEQLALEKKIGVEQQEKMDAVLDDLQQAVEMGMLGGQEMATAIVEDLVAQKVDIHKAVSMMAQEIRDGSFTLQEARNAFRAKGIDAPLEIHQFAGQPHNQASLKDYVSIATDKTLAVQKWMGSLNQFYDTAPEWMVKARNASMTKEEKTLFSDWRKEVKSIGNRKINISTEGTTLAEVFPNALFRRFNLDQMRHPSKIVDPQLRMALRSIYGNGDALVQAWLNDLYLIQNQRKDLFRTALRDLAPTDRKAYIAYAQHKRSADIAQAKMITSSSYWSQLLALTEERFSRTAEGRARGEFYKARMYDADLHEQQSIVLDAFTESNLLAKNFTSLKDAIASMDVKESTAERLLNDFFEEMKQRDVANSLDPDQALDDMRQRGFDANAPVSYDYENENVLQRIYEEDDINDLDSDAYLGDDKNGPLSFKRGVFSGRITAGIVRNFVRDLSESWKNAPQIEVVKNIRALDEPLRSRVLEALGVDGDAKGMMDPDTGIVYLFSDNLTSQLDVQFTLFHETFGHYGIRGVLGNTLDSFLKGVYKTNPSIARQADALVEKGMGLLEAVEEVLSDNAAIQSHPALVKIYIGKIINALRNAGFDGVADFLASLSNAEVSYILASAKAYAVNGGSSSMNGVPSIVRFNRDRPKAYEIYAVKGDTFLGYARYNPAFGDWYVFASRSKEDIRKGEYKSFIVDSYEAALEALHKTGGRITERTRSKFYVDDTTPKSGFSLPVPKFNDVKGWRKVLRDGIIKVQNEYYAIREYENFLKETGRMEGIQSPLQLLKLMESKAVYLLENMDKTYYKPYIDLMKRLAKITGKDDAERDVLDYLYARHAPERNKAVQKINNDPKKGSGMTDEEAHKILKENGFKFNAKGEVVLIDPKNVSDQQQILLDIGKIFEDMSHAKVNYLVKTGLLSNTRAAYLNRYKYYISLSGLPGESLDEEDMTQFDNAKRLNVRGQDAKRAMGRKTKAEDIMARTFMGYRSSIIRGQKNLVGQSILEMLELNKDPTFAVINKIAEKDVIEQTGYKIIPDVIGYKTIPTYMVMKKLDENFINQDDVMVVKAGGVVNLIQFTDNSPGSVFDALHGRMYRDNPGAISETFGKYNRFLGQMLTTWNPAWVLVNGVRDTQTAFLNAASDGRVGTSTAARMMRRLPSSFAAAASYYGGGKLFNGNPKMMAHLEEMISEGGLTMFMGRKDGTDYMDDLRIAMHGPETTFEQVKVKTKAITDFMEKMTNPMEVMPRLAAYATLRETVNKATGEIWTAKDAAEFAKELTVNFNMRGTSKELRNWFVFFNPAVQGTAKIIDLAIHNPKRFAILASSWATVGFMMSLVARAAGADGEDDDGETDPVNQLDQIPDYKRSTSMIFSPNTIGAALPLAYGWNAFYALGHHGMDYILGVQPLSVVTGRVLKASAEAFLPNTAGLEASTLPRKLLMTAMPTALMPVAQLAINENRFGAPIYKEKNALVPGEHASSYMNFDSASPISVGLARGLNEMTGGTKYESGFADFNPSVIDFLINSYGAGLPAETYKSASTGIRVARGEDVANTPLPIIDRFTARAPEKFDAGGFRRVRDEVKTVIKELDDPTTTDDRKDELLTKYEDVRSANAMITSIDYQMRDNRDRQKRAEAQYQKGDIDRDDLSEVKNEVRAKEKALTTRAVRLSLDSGFSASVLGLK